MKFKGSRHYSKEEMHQVLIESILELSGNLEEVSGEIKTHLKRVRIVKYNIEKDVLRETMEPKKDVLLAKAIEEGLLNK